MSKFKTGDEVLIRARVEGEECGSFMVLTPSGASGFWVTESEMEHADCDELAGTIVDALDMIAGVAMDAACALAGLTSADKAYAFIAKAESTEQALKCRVMLLRGKIERMKEATK
jgi:hypothetical protein